MASNTEIGTAYLRVKPKVDGSFERDLESAGGRAGKGFGGAFQVAMGNILADVAESAVSFIGGALKQAFTSYADYEQLKGGVQKIFNDMDTTRILGDAQNAFKELNMSANDYMSTINQVGAAFSANMGDERAYEAARKGMLAIADFASGTGLSVDELNEKFRIISKSTQSYQAVCDQFSGILPQTADEFLRQAQAAGYLSDEYTSLTEVPVGEYQQALVEMMAQGVEGLTLTGNTLAESSETISGSLAALRSAWSNFLVGIFDEDADMDTLVENLLTSLGWAFNNVMPRLMQAAESFFMAIPQALMNVLAEHFPGLSEALGQIAEAFKPGMEAMQRMAEEVGPMLAPMLQRLGEMAGDILLPAIIRLVDAFSDWLVAIEPYAPMLMQITEALLGGLVMGLTTTANTLAFVFEAASMFATILAKVGEVVMTVGARIGDFASKAAKHFENFKQSASDTFEKARTKLENWAQSASDAMQNVQNAFSNAWSTITGIFSNGADTIYGIMNNVHSFIWGIVNNISSAFSSISIQWPHIPLPHFNWHWESIGGMINIPWFDGISWYAKGGFIDDATLIGVGERGGELVWPSYEPYLGRYADAIASRINDNDDDMASLREDLRNMRLVLAIDGRAFAEATVGDIDRAMGSMSRRAVAR